MDKDSALLLNAGAHYIKVPKLLDILTVANTIA